MFKKIALAHDGSDNAERALAYATDLAAEQKASLLVIHVEEGMIGRGGDELRDERERRQAEISRTPEELAERGVDAEVRLDNVVLGGPAPSIVRIAEEEGADLIVVGSRGLSAVSGVILGSVAQRLIHLSKQPVLVVPPDAGRPA